MLTTTTTQPLSDLPVTEVKPLDTDGESPRPGSINDRFEKLANKATKADTKPEQEAEAPKKDSEASLPTTDAEIDSDDAVADKDLAKALRDLMAEGETETETKDKTEKTSDADKDKDKDEKPELASLTRQERYYYDKAKGDPIRMAKNITQAEQHIADQKAELAELMAYAESTQPRFYMADAVERAAEELREENPEWSESKVSRMAKAAALIEKEDFESERRPQVQSYQEFIQKQQRREAEREQGMAEARNQVEKLFLDHTGKNTGLTRYAMEKAMDASRDEKKKMDMASLLDEAQAEFETHVIEHLQLSPSFGPKLNAVIESIAAKNEALEKKLAINYLRKNISATGASKATAQKQKQTANDDDDANRKAAAYATGNKRVRRDSGQINKDGDKMLKNIFTRLGI